MKVTFSWKNTVGVVSPHCTSETTNRDGINLLSCLLMDDGGIPYPLSIPWIREGIKRADSVLSGGTVSSSWDREAWGAVITIDGVKIYSFHDEGYFENITFRQFNNALVSWRDFLESKPNFRKKKNIEL